MALNAPKIPIQTEFGFDTAIPPKPWSQPSTALPNEWVPGKIEHSVPYITTPGFPPLVPEAKPELPWVPTQQPDTIRQELGIYNEQELAAALGVTADTLGQWRAKNTGPDHVKLGKAVFYRREDVAKWVGP